MNFSSEARFERGGGNQFFLNLYLQILLTHLESSFLFLQSSEAILTFGLDWKMFSINFIGDS